LQSSDNKLPSNSLLSPERVNANSSCDLNIYKDDFNFKEILNMSKENKKNYINHNNSEDDIILSSILKLYSDTDTKEDKNDGKKIRYIKSDLGLTNEKLQITNKKFNSHFCEENVKEEIISHKFDKFLLNSNNDNSFIELKGESVNLIKDVVISKNNFNHDNNGNSIIETTHIYDFDS